MAHLLNFKVTRLLEKLEDLFDVIEVLSGTQREQNGVLKVDQAALLPTFSQNDVQQALKSFESYF